jgi:hypothetical protein
MPGSSVKVAVRCRPFSPEDLEFGSTESVIVGSEGKLWLINDRGGDGSTPFAFDNVFDASTPQEDIYSALGRPLLDQAFAGYNGTIFAYGQTGSGKTHSMIGSSTCKGVIPRVNEELFERIENGQKEQPTIQYLVLCSFFEIYNETIHDLLDPSASACTPSDIRQLASANGLQIKEHPLLGVHVQGLQEAMVTDAQEIHLLMDQGSAARTIGATNTNAHSSRSHAIFTIKLHQKEMDPTNAGKKDVFCKINLVDLAGSERAKSSGAKGSRLREGANINQSLSALGNVINSLAENSNSGDARVDTASAAPERKEPQEAPVLDDAQTAEAPLAPQQRRKTPSTRKRVFVPYRNSKLTRVLQDALGGNSDTTILTTISTGASCYAETLSTLRFAARAKCISVHVVRNEVRKGEEEAKVGRLTQEIAALKLKLLEVQAPSSVTALDADRSTEADAGYDAAERGVGASAAAGGRQDHPSSDLSSNSSLELQRFRRQLADSESALRQLQQHAAMLQQQTWEEKRALSRQFAAEREQERERERERQACAQEAAKGALREERRKRWMLLEATKGADLRSLQATIHQLQLHKCWLLPTTNGESVISGEDGVPQRKEGALETSMRVTIEAATVLDSLGAQLNREKGLLEDDSGCSDSADSTDRADSNIPTLTLSSRQLQSQWLRAVALLERAEEAVKGQVQMVTAFLKAFETDLSDLVQATACMISKRRVSKPEALALAHVLAHARRRLVTVSQELQTLSGTEAQVCSAVKVLLRSVEGYEGSARAARSTNGARAKRGRSNSNQDCHDDHGGGGTSVDELEEVQDKEQEEADDETSGERALPLLRLLSRQLRSRLQEVESRQGEGRAALSVVIAARGLQCAQECGIFDLGSVSGSGAEGASEQLHTLARSLGCLGDRGGADVGIDAAVDNSEWSAAQAVAQHARAQEGVLGVMVRVLQAVEACEHKGEEDVQATEVEEQEQSSEVSNGDPGHIEKEREAKREAERGAEREAEARRCRELEQKVKELTAEMKIQAAMLVQERAKVEALVEEARKTKADPVKKTAEDAVHETKVLVVGGSEAEVRRLQARLEKAGRQIVALESARKQSMETAAKSVSVVGELQQRNKEQLNMLRSEVQRLAEDLRGSAKCEAESRQKLQAMEADLRQERAVRSAGEASAAVAKQKAEAATARAITAEKQIVAHVEQAKASEAALKEELAEMRRELEERSSAAAEMEVELVRIRAAEEGKDERAKRGEKRVWELETFRDDLLRMNALLQSKLDMMQTSERETGTENERLQARLQGEATVENDELLKLRRANIELEAAKAAAEVRAKAAETAAKAAAKEKTQAERSCGRYAGRVERLEAKYSVTLQEIAELRDERDEAMRAVDEYEFQAQAQVQAYQEVTVEPSNGTDNATGSARLEVQRQRERVCELELELREKESDDAVARKAEERRENQREEEKEELEQKLRARAEQIKRKVAALGQERARVRELEDEARRAMEVADARRAEEMLPLQHQLERSGRQIQALEAALGMEKMRKGDGEGIPAESTPDGAVMDRLRQQLRDKAKAFHALQATVRAKDEAIAQLQSAVDQAQELVQTQVLRTEVMQRCQQEAREAETVAAEVAVKMAEERARRTDEQLQLAQRGVLEGGEREARLLEDLSVVTEERDLAREAEERLYWQLEQAEEGEHEQLQLPQQEKEQQRDCREVQTQIHERVGADFVEAEQYEAQEKQGQGLACDVIALRSVLAEVSVLAVEVPVVGLPAPGSPKRGKMRPLKPAPPVQPHSPTAA